MVTNKHPPSIEDQVLTKKILQYLNQFSSSDLMDASLLVDNGKVILSGRVSSKKLKKKIVSGLKKTFGISELLDELFVFRSQHTHGHQRSVFKDLGL
jgi:osmotically-inducible protein OsmY